MRQDVAIGRANHYVQGTARAQRQAGELRGLPVDPTGPARAGPELKGNMRHFAAQADVFRPAFPVAFRSCIYMECAEPGAEPEGWLFPSPRKSGPGHVLHLSQYYRAITGAAGTRFWFHGLRNAFITVAERELMLPRSLTKRLVNHARPGDVTEGYAADWTVEQLREPAQRVADRIDELTAVPVPGSARAA